MTRKRSHRTRALLLTGSLLAVLSCRVARVPRTSIVLVTVENLRADRLVGRAPSGDPFPNLRALTGGEGRVRRVLASSSESLPSLASLFTGVSPGRHLTMVEGIDRLPFDLPTLASVLGSAGYRTAGFPSLASLGLSSGLARGFQTYGWPPGDVLPQVPLSGTDGKGWVAGAGRRPGEATVADALNWLALHRSESFFLWIHLSEAAPPYATDPRLIGAFRGSIYDAALAYDDRCIKSLVDGLVAAGLKERTTLVVAGDHGASLGFGVDSMQGLDLDPPALETGVAIIPPGAKGGSPIGTGASSSASSASSASSDRPGRLLDLYATVLELAGLPLPSGVEAKPGLPPVSGERPLIAATLGPRSAFGWHGRIALYDGDWVWAGSDGAEEEETMSRMGDGPPSRGIDRVVSAADGAKAMRQQALALAGPLGGRLQGRREIPPREKRRRVLELLETATAAHESRDETGELRFLREAWGLDPGNYRVACLLADVEPGRTAEEFGSLVREVEARSPGLPEAYRAQARVFDAARDGARAREALARACAGGADGCTVDLAIRLARGGRQEEGATLLAPLAEKTSDPDLWLAAGDMYMSLQNTYRAGQAYEKAAALRPDDPDILLRQGDCLAAVRDDKGATAKYEAARVRLPGSRLVELRLGNLAQLQGDRRAAVEHYRLGLGADTSTPPGEVTLARVLAERGLLEEAMPMFLDAASRDTRSGAALYFAAEALAAAGKEQEAETYLRQSLEREPQNPAALYQLARIVVHRGDADEGARLLEQLAPLAPAGMVKMALEDPIFSASASRGALQKGLEKLVEALQRGQKGRGPGRAAPDAAAPAAGPAAAKP